MPHGKRSLSELLQHRKELSAYMDSTGILSLPEDFTTEIPTSVLSWLLKAGVSCSIAKHYGFGWSAKLGRIVIPVWEDNALVAVQSRAVYQDQKPKYLNKTGGPVRSPSFRSDDSLLLGAPLFDHAMVITEDILSAVRVGRVLPARSTLGTNLPDNLCVTLMTGGVRHVFVWYDGDAAGVRGALKAHKTLELLGMAHTIIKTDKDPKEYNNEEITEIILENKT